jgi:hypothetical protein
MMREVKRLLRQWEGLELQAYRCPAGCWTIGYGHAIRDGRGVPVTNKRAAMALYPHGITKAQAEALLDADLAQAQAQLEALTADVVAMESDFKALCSWFAEPPTATAESTFGPIATFVQALEQANADNAKAAEKEKANAKLKRQSLGLLGRVASKFSTPSAAMANESSSATPPASGAASTARSRRSLSGAAAPTEKKPEAGVVLNELQQALNRGSSGLRRVSSFRPDGEIINHETTDGSTAESASYETNYASGGVPAEEGIEIPRQLKHASLAKRSALADDFESGARQQIVVSAGGVLKRGGGEEDSHELRKGQRK